MSNLQIGRRESQLLGCPRQVDALGALALSLDLEWIKGRIFMIVTCYVDETGMDGPRVLLAGYASRLHDWIGFNKQWQKLLDDDHIPYSHILEMRAGKDPFAGWDDYRTRVFMGKAIKVIEKYCSFGITSAVDVKTHKAYRDTLPAQAHADSAYGLCARQFFEHVPDYVENVMGLRHAKVNFIFESHKHRFGDAERIFNDLRKVNEGFRKSLGVISSADREDFLGLQAADMLAFVARKAEPEAKFDSNWPDKPKKKRGVCPVFHVGMTDESIPVLQQVSEGVSKLKRWQKQARQKEKRGARDD